MLKIELGFVRNPEGLGKVKYKFLNGKPSWTGKFELCQSMPGHQNWHLKDSFAFFVYRTSCLGISKLSIPESVCVLAFIANLYSEHFAHVNSSVRRIVSFGGKREPLKSCSTKAISAGCVAVGVGMYVCVIYPLVAISI